MNLSQLVASVALASLALGGCAGASNGPQLPPASFVATEEGPGEEYVIGPLDELTIFVWRNPELGAQVQVRPDGRITTPLITDMPAVGKTPSMLAQDAPRNSGTSVAEGAIALPYNTKVKAGNSQAASIVGVLPTAGRSVTSGVVMRPSGRT